MAIAGASVVAEVTVDILAKRRKNSLIGKGSLLLCTADLFLILNVLSLYAFRILSKLFSHLRGTTSHCRTRPWPKNKNMTQVIKSITVFKLKTNQYCNCIKNHFRSHNEVKAATSLCTLCIEVHSSETSEIGMCNSDRVLGRDSDDRSWKRWSLKKNNNNSDWLQQHLGWHPELWLFSLQQHMVSKYRREKREKLG